MAIIAHSYALEENSGIRVDAELGLNLDQATNDSVTALPGRIGMGLNASAGNLRVFNVGGIPNYNADSCIGVECWVKFDNPAGTLESLIWLGGPSRTVGIFRREISGAFSWNIRNSVPSSFIVTSNTITVPHVWYHVVVTWHQNFDMLLYVNGKLDAPALPLPNIGLRTMAGDAMTSFGASNVGAENMTGILDQVNMYVVIPTAEEVLKSYNNGWGSFGTNDLTPSETSRARSLIRRCYPGVDVIVRGIDAFELYDKRTTRNTRNDPPLPGQIGPLKSNYAGIRTYLDPLQQVLPPAP